MPDSPLTIRTLTAKELPDLVSVVTEAFLDTPSPANTAREVALLESERTHGVFEGDRLIGGGGILSKLMTLPGGTQQPVAAVTLVGVAPGHRRRGVMTKLMRAQLHEIHEAGIEAFASLFASEGGIYGRFGYGLAAQRATVSIPRGAEFMSAVDTGVHRIHELDRETALPIVDELYRQVAARQPGWITRSQQAWALYLTDDPEHLRREKLTPYRFAVHPDGYGIYRAEAKWGDRGPEGVLHVREIVARTSQAHAAVWRYLLDVDLVGTVEYGAAAADEAIRHMLANPYQANRENYDSLWVRIIDIDRALPLRRYSAPVDAVLAVADEFCPWNVGSWRLVADTEGVGTVERTTAEPDLVLTSNELGAVYLGGTTVSELAAAQRIRELTPGAVTALSRALRGDCQPHCPETF